MNLMQLLILAEDEAAEAASAPAAPAGDANPLMSFMPLLVIFGIFYFFVIRPQTKRQREEQEKRRAELDALKRDDEVVTIGGIIGTIAHISEDRKEVTIKTSDSTRLRMLRSAIQGLLKSQTPETAPNAAEKPLS